jgi:hypothetical protein
LYDWFILSLKDGIVGLSCHSKIVSLGYSVIEIQSLKSCSQKVSTPMKLIGFLLSFIAFFIHSFAVWLGYFARSLNSPRPLYRRSTWRYATCISTISLLSLTFSLRFTSLLSCSSFACLLPIFVLLPCHRLDSLPPKTPFILAGSNLIFLIILTICSPTLSDLPFSFSVSQTRAFIFLAICASIVLFSAILLKKYKFLIVPLLGTSSSLVLISLSLLARIIDSFEGQRLLFLLLWVLFAFISHFYGLARFLASPLTAFRFAAVFLIYASLIAVYAVSIDPPFANVSIWWTLFGWLSYIVIIGVTITAAHGLWPTNPEDAPEAERLLAEGIF